MQLYWFKKLYLTNKIFRGFVLLIFFILVVYPVYKYGKKDGKRMVIIEKIK